MGGRTLPGSTVPATITSASIPLTDAAASANGAFTPRDALASGQTLAVDPKCICLKNTSVHGVDVGVLGCNKHGQEPNAGVEAYCYVEGGDECGGSMPSQLHSGIYWVNCEKPDLMKLFAPTCEIRKRAEAEVFPIPAGLGLKAPPGFHAHVNGTVLNLPNETHPLDEIHADLATWPGSMPPSWHADHNGSFADGPFQNLPPSAASGVNGTAASYVQKESHAANLRGVQRH
jgi:hypothetical protein